MKCHWCKRMLVEGEDAYIQEIKNVKVVGDKVSMTIVEVIACLTCTNPSEVHRSRDAINACPGNRAAG